MPIRYTPVLLLFLGVACADREAADGAAEAVSSEAESRPASMTDTLMIEGMPQPLDLGLFRAGDDLPLQFSAYVPEDMAQEGDEGDGDGASLRFVAELGGARNDLAFVHLFVYPPGTDPQHAVGVVRAYQTHAGVPVSKGLEPLGESEAARRMPWADHAYSFRYQAGGTWYLGSIGIGTHSGRLYHLVVHYPAEYADGFVPRAGIILETWRWADGSSLESGTDASDITIPSARPDSLP